MTKTVALVLLALVTSCAKTQDTRLPVPDEQRLSVPTERTDGPPLIAPPPAYGHKIVMND
jgi:hypothetical protein